MHSLHHKPTGRELLYRNPVFQPADFALNGAWFSGGIEWNIGATGHTTLSCAPLHAARVPAPDGGEMLRLWEWERLRDLPFQVDLWLPEGSDFLYVGVRIRNPHHRTVPVYWWSNIAVPEDARTRVLAPADEAWHFGYERDPAPRPGAASPTAPTAPTRCAASFPADYFYEVPDGARRWIASLDGDGRGLVQTSTDLLRGRKLFLWGRGAAGGAGSSGSPSRAPAATRRSRRASPVRSSSTSRWTAEASSPGWRRTARWPPTRRPCTAPTGRAARAEAAARLEAALPRADVDAAYAAWRPYADHRPEGVAGHGLRLGRAGGGPRPDSTCPARRSTRRPSARTRSPG